MDHISELNNNIPKKPLFFLKPDTAIQPKGHPFFIPDFSNNINYEVEIVIKINKTGKYIDKSFAYKYFNEISVGIDFTARDLQDECKKKGHPWEISKGFDGSAQISDKFLDKSEIDLQNLNFSLKKNNELVQNGNSSSMIFDFDEIISYISKFYTLKIGDLIYTGTPSGVGQVIKGDFLEAYINNEPMMKVMIK